MSDNTKCPACGEYLEAGCCDNIECNRYGHDRNTMPDETKCPACGGVLRRVHENTFLHPPGGNGCPLDTMSASIYAWREIHRLRNTMPDGTELEPGDYSLRKWDGETDMTMSHAWDLKVCRFTIPEPAKPEPLGCGNHGCPYGKPGGMKTNGVCKCPRPVPEATLAIIRAAYPSADRLEAGWAWYALDSRAESQGLCPYLWRIDPALLPPWEGEGEPPVISLREEK